MVTTLRHVVAGWPVYIPSGLLPFVYSANNKLCDFYTLSSLLFVLFHQPDSGPHDIKLFILNSTSPEIVTNH